MYFIIIQVEIVVYLGVKFELVIGSILVGCCCIINEWVYIGVYFEDFDIVKLGGVFFGEYVIVEVDCIIELGDIEIGDGSFI